MTYDPDFMDSVIKRSNWFRQLPDDAVQQLASKAVIKSYAPEQFLYLIGEPQQFICCVLTGVVRVSVMSSMGQEFVLTDLYPDSWMGEISLTGGASQVTEAMIVEPSELLLIPARVVKQVAEDHPGIYKNLFFDHMQRSRSIYELLAGMLFYPLKSRLAGRLLVLLEKHGEPGAEGLELDVHLSQLDFARMSMGSRQRVNKIFREWVKQGLILKRRDKYIVKDMAALRAEIELQDFD